MDISEQTSALWRGYQTALAVYNKGNHAEAKARLQNLVAENPQFGDSYNLLGICHFSLNELAEAKLAIKSAIATSPREDFYSNLGMVLAASGDLDEAVGAYRCALELSPQAADICNNYANVLSNRKQYDEAIELYRRAIALNPKYIEAHRNLVTALYNAKRANEASPTLRSMGTLGELQFEMRRLVDWRDLRAVEDACLQQVSEGTLLPIAPQKLFSLRGMNPSLELKAAYKFALNRTSVAQVTPLSNAKKISITGRRVKIGYLCADLAEHSIMRMLAGVLDAHNLRKNEIVLFSYGPALDEEYAKRLKATGCARVDISQISNHEAAQTIFTHELDILVDLSGYADEATVEITAQRPAPIIVNWLGYPGTLGHERLADYIIGDAVVTPPEDAEFYSERLALMPLSYQPNDHVRPLPEGPTRTEIGLPEDALVFCSFNEITKFNPQTFDIWSRLLLAVPNSILWLDLHQSPARDNAMKEFLARGIGGERIYTYSLVSQKERLASLRLADIALDTFPYSSNTTASDAIWAGVPLVTLKGEIFSSKIAASLLAAHGFAELVTESENDYFTLALELATNAQRRAEMKTRLDRARTASPLFDTAKFTKDLEQLYRAIIKNHNKQDTKRARIVTVK